jgi:hypothetical protein
MRGVLFARFYEELAHYSYMGISFHLKHWTCTQCLRDKAPFVKWTVPENSPLQSKVVPMASSNANFFENLRVVTALASPTHDLRFTLTPASDLNQFPHPK